MLQSNLSGHSAPQLAIFHQQSASSQQPAPCEKSAEFLKAFEILTGWQAEFQESSASQKHRQIAPHDPPQGEFKVVDMSPDWPARTPTAHRGRCDQLIHLFGELIAELQTTRADLVRAHSTLEAMVPGSVAAEVQLVDSFVPKFTDPITETGSLVSGDLNSLSEEETNTRDGDDDFTLADDNFSIGEPLATREPEPELDAEEFWKRWKVGGATGVAEDVYLDWFMNGANLSICVGKIESSFGIGDAEVQLEIDPVAARYRIQGDADLEAFFVWDRRGAKLVSADRSGDWVQLPPAAAVVATTHANVVAPDPEAELSTVPTAQQLANAIGRNLDAEQKVLVLKRLPEANG